MDAEYSFGHWIRQRRTALGLTQAVLAERVGYSAAMQRKIENDERRPSAEAAARLAQALQIPRDQYEAFLKVARQERATDQLGLLQPEPHLPWPAPARPPTNLPLPTTLFIGREEELARLARLLADPACRLVTLVGLAGIGKTRLALQAAQGQLDRYAQGVFFVSLAGLGTPDRIGPSVARTIGFQSRGQAEPEEQLLAYLREKDMLLVLDNFEHLLEGASLLAKIMLVAPSVRLLVTSRERLNLQGEWLLEVDGLPYPTTPAEAGATGVETYAAVQLFLQGALRTNPRFRLTDENRAWVVRICQLTAGMPLAIELAAAWVRLLPLPDILREIQTSLDFLKRSAQDLPERHRSLRAALDHSWNLLTNREKGVLRRLSVFRGGFRREGAQKVAGARLDDIASLLDKSLLKRVSEERYDLHELIRQYAAAHLEAEPHERDQTHDRHGRYYAYLLGQWERQLRSPRQVEVLAEMEAEIDNVRLAWSWMLARQQVEHLQQSLNCVFRFHLIRTRFREGAHLFEQAARALQAAGPTDEAHAAERGVALGQLLARQGYFYLGLGRHEAGRELLHESLALLRASTDQARVAETLATLSFMQYWLAEFDQARQLAEESLELNRALGNLVGMVLSLVTLAHVYLAQGAYAEAYTYAGESLAIWRDHLGDPHGTAISLSLLSAAANRLGRYEEAKRYGEESLETARTVNDLWWMGIILRQLGEIHRELGEIGPAAARFQHSVSQFREVGDRTLMAVSLVDLGAATRASGACAESKAHLLAALQTAVEAQAWGVVLNALTELADLEMEAGEGEWALELVIQCQQAAATKPEADGQAKLESQLALGRSARHRQRRLEQLRGGLEARLTPQQVAQIEERARSRSLDGFVRDLLDQRTGE